jgi:fructose-1,6-bisphosphatase/inositol monophosphatase family enzyme
MQAGEHYPAVLIARYSGGQTTLGVAYFPLTDEWFYAQRGCCAWKNGKRLNNRLALEPELSSSWVEMNQYGDAAYETKDFVTLRNGLRSRGGASLVTTTVPNSGVALRIAEAKNGLVAAIHDNRADKVKQAAWDIAAVQLILEEAGGVFVNLSGDSIDPFQPEVMIVARTPEIAKRIIRLADSLKTAS